MNQILMGVAVRKGEDSKKIVENARIFSTIEVPTMVVCDPDDEHLYLNKDHILVCPWKDNNRTAASNKLVLYRNLLKTEYEWFSISDSDDKIDLDGLMEWNSKAKQLSPKSKVLFPNIQMRNILRFSANAPTGLLLMTRRTNQEIDSHILGAVFNRNLLERFLACHTNAVFEMESHADLLLIRFLVENGNIVRTRLPLFHYERSRKHDKPPIAAFLRALRDWKRFKRACPTLNSIEWSRLFWSQQFYCISRRPLMGAILRWWIVRKWTEEIFRHSTYSTSPAAVVRGPKESGNDVVDSTKLVENSNV